jgi:hypothetical protein
VITGVSKIVINIEDLDANDRAVGVGRDNWKCLSLQRRRRRRQQVGTAPRMCRARITGRSPRNRIGLAQP